MVERSVGLEQEMRSAYLDYAMSVIVSRALPDVRDGLKPVQRRVLYSMYDQGMRNNSAYRKSATVVGNVLAKYHPHGDSPVYEAMVRLAQTFSLRYPLVDGQGNFGSVDNDPPAAMRYTEARLTSIAEEMLTDIDRETVDFTDNFDGSEKEPVVLPTQLPNMLLNGASGIAVGMATSIPPHNLREVCDAILFALDRWRETDIGGDFDATLEELLEHIKGPDFPTAGLIRGVAGIKQAYATGQGKVVMEAKASIEDAEKGRRKQIIVSELPYQVNKASLVEKIADLVRSKKLDGIAEIRDESDRDGLRVSIDLQRNAQPEVVLNNLYEHTTMRSAFHINTLALVNGAPQVLSLKQIIFHYIQFRREIITNRTRFELRRAQDRAHVLEGLRTALDDLDPVIAVIRNAESADAARITLIERWTLSQRQAQAILDMQLRRLAALESKAIMDELEDLRERISELEGILGDPVLITNTVKEEVTNIREKYGDKRRTKIMVAELQKVRHEDLIPHQEVVVTLSNRGYIKRVASETYRIQRRGGRGITGMVTREEDAVRKLLVADTHDTLLFFTNRGRVTTLRCFELPGEVSRTARGLPVTNLVPLDTTESVTTIMAASDLSEADYLVFVTRKGEIKRSPLKHFISVRSTGKKAMDLEPDDDLVSVIMAKADDEVVLVTERGKSLRFSSNVLKPRSATAGGVRGIRLPADDNVIGVVTLSDPERFVFVISKKGYGKMSKTELYMPHGRGTNGQKTFNTSLSRTGLLNGLAMVKRDQEIILVSRKGIVIRTTLGQVPVQGKVTGGVRVMRLDSDDEVAAIAPFEDSGNLEEESTKKTTKAKAKTKTKAKAKKKKK
tara:strand:+ start:3107 stop:5644 length:2538 start_codon:yes stop_codon:yes gene_type:complete